MPQPDRTTTKPKKEKIGTTVLESTLEGLETLRAKKPASIRSVGEAIDFLCDMLLDMEPTVAKELLAFFTSRIDACETQLKSLRYPDAMGYAGSELRQELAFYSKFADHLRTYCDLDGLDNAMMRRVDLQDGDYLICPKSWPILNESEAPRCRGVSVIEVVRAGDMCAPRFVYLKPETGPMNAGQRAEALTLVQMVWPDIEKALLDELPLFYDSNGIHLNEREHLESPAIRYFTMPEAASCRKRDDAPFGAKVFRT